MLPDVIFIVERDPALSVAREHFAAKRKADAVVEAIAAELGITRVYRNKHTGEIAGVAFADTRHPDFNEPTEGVSFPKPGSDWAVKLARHTGYPDQAMLISETFSIPLTVDYTNPDGTGCWSDPLGSSLAECGFIELQENGPYAIWVPDVPGHVANYKEAGYVVKEPANSYKLQLAGCRRLSLDEWQGVVQRFDRPLDMKLNPLIITDI
jgi:hypothetical protein